MSDYDPKAESAALHAMYPSMATPAPESVLPPDPALVARYPTMYTAEEKAAAKARVTPPAAPPAVPAPEKNPVVAEAERQARALDARYPTMADPAAEPAKVDPSVVAAYALTLPAEVQADDPLLGRYKELAVRHKLPPTVASELLALHAEAAGVPQHWRGAEGWEAEALALPEMRNGGAEAVAVAAALADPETKAFLLESGLGNHPQLVKWAAKIGRELQRLRGGRR